MLQIDWNKWIVYNNEGLLVFVEAYDKEQIKDPELDKIDVYCRIYSNESNIPTKDIKANLKKTVSMKDRINFRVKKNFLYGPFTKMISFDRKKDLVPVYLSHDVSKNKIDQIIEMIETFLEEGKVILDAYEENGFKVNDVSLEEFSKILDGFEILESKHKKESLNIGR